MRRVEARAVQFKEAQLAECVVVKLRGESIQGQLDGTIPSTDAEQRSSDALIDASALELSVMGTMNTGGPSEQAGRFERPNADAAAATGAAPEGEDAQQPESGNEDSSAALQAEQDGESADAQPRGGPGASDSRKRENTGSLSGLVTAAICAAVLLAAAAFALLYRRRPH